MTTSDGTRFLDPDVLQEARRLLETQRPEFSIDAWYAQMGIGPEEVPDMLSEAVQEAAAGLYLLPVEGWMIVHREIVAPEDWDHAAETRPHRYWSHDAALAHAHWGIGEGVRWLVTGRVRIEDVDHATTIALNANPMLSDEAEIRLRPGAAVETISVQRRPPGHSHPIL